MALTLVAVIVVGLPAAILMARFRPARADVVTLVAGPGGWDPPILSVIAGRPFQLQATSWDHIHGLTLASFGISAELAPGVVRRFELTPQEPGAFPFFSHIPCGHDRMQGWLVVTPR